MLLPQSPFNAIFDEIVAAIAHTRFKSMLNQKWKDVDFIIYWIEPIMHKLLSMEYPLKFTDSVLRLGICLFLGPIRSDCGKLGVSTKIYVAKLKSLLREPKNCRAIEDNIPKRLLLWILFFGLLESWELPEEEWFIEATIKTGRDCGLHGWNDILEAIRSFLWMDEMFTVELERTRDRLMLDL